MSKNSILHSRSSSFVKVRCGLAVILLTLIIAAGLEANATFILPHHWGRLLSSPGLLTIVGYVVLLACGIFAVGFSLWAPDKGWALSQQLARLRWGRWLGIVVLVLFMVWFYLYSPWQGVFPGPWTHLLFLLGLAQIIGILAQPRGIVFPGWQEGLLALCFFLYIRVILELRAMTPLAAVYRTFTLIGFFIILGTILILYRQEVSSRAETWSIALRDRLGWVRWLLVAFLALVPVFLLYLVGGKNYATNTHTRLITSLIAALGIAALVGRGGERVRLLQGLSVGAGLQLFSTAFAAHLILVNNYPFTLYWSEGNRFYDYSLIFGQGLYNYPGKIEVPYFSPGRYALWGIPFLWSGLPIWIHRLWNALLGTIPPLILGWLITRKTKDGLASLSLTLWLALYLLQGPVYPPLLLAAILVLVFAFKPSPIVRGFSVFIASLYAALSRWTWAVGSGVWGALIDLFLYYPQRKGTFIRRILPAIIIAIIGVLPGALVSWRGGLRGVQSLAFQQSLLWYRLLPNPTYPLGILLGITMATGPLVAVLVWLVVSRRWRLDGLQILAAASASLGLLCAGIVISAKIGGGGDLHNLDMYIISLGLLAGLAIYSLDKEGAIQPRSWPCWVQVVLILLVFIPAYNAFRVGDFTELPTKNIVQASLTTIQKQVTRAQRTGEVLFMDQRQLLTFGYIQGVTLVPEYEKKFMMDQAMAGNATYFQKYYQDLTKKRFSLIITEPLDLRYRGEIEGHFSDENDAWVRWVSEPTLCFYEPAATIERVRIQLLVPRQDTSDCTRFLIN
jgi:hypothetical protein